MCETENLDQQTVPFSERVPTDTEIQYTFL